MNQEGRRIHAIELAGIRCPQMALITRMDRTKGYCGLARKNPSTPRAERSLVTIQSKSARGLLFALFTLGPLSGCVNVEREIYPLDWSKSVDVSKLAELNGTYSVRAESTSGHDADRPLDELWYFLTREDDDARRDDIVRLAAIEDERLLVELLDRNQQLKSSVTLSAGDGFTWSNGALRLRPESGVERGALGTAAGTGTCRLRRTEDGGLAGETDGIAVGLVLHVLPGVGAGNDWFYWRKLE